MSLFLKKCTLRFTLLASVKQALVAFFRFSLPKTLASPRQRMASHPRLASPLAFGDEASAFHNTVL